MSRRPVECIVLALALLALALPASSAQTGWSVQQLMQQLARPRPSEAKFVERKYLKVLEAPIELSGRLLYLAPDRLEKHTLQPTANTMIVNGDDLTIHEAGRRKPRKLRLQDHPALWGFIESMRATLAGDLPALERFYTVGLDGTADDWELTLAPRVEAMRSVVKLIRIGGTEGRVRWIEVIEARGDRSVTQIFEDGR